MFRYYFFSFLFLFGVLLSPVNAQEYDDEYFDFGDAAGGLVVTAGRTPEPSAGVPAQITVISSEDIAASGAVNVIGVLEIVPGVHFSGALSGPGSDAVSMRGFGENSFGRVLILVDGNKLNDPDMKAANWNAIPLSDIERIEVMDGSASVQYGNYAVGGVINIITKKSGQRRTVLGVSGGSFLSHRESISHFQPASWGSFSISADNTGTDGYRERQYSRTTNISAGTEIFLGGSTILSLNASFADLGFQLPGGLSPEEFDKDPKKASYYDDENSERHFGGGIGLQWFPSGYFELKLPFNYKGKLIKMDMASYGSYTDRVLNTVELRPQGILNFKPAGMPLRFITGIDAYFMKLGAESYSNPNYTVMQNSFSITEWTLGSYLTAWFSPLPVLSFSAGARFDMAMLYAKNKDSSVDENNFYSAFVYEGGVVFTPVKNLKFYAKYSSLFRYPFVDEVASLYGFGADSFNMDLKPETGFNAELGASFKLGEMLDVNANFFFMQLSDEICYNEAAWKNENLDKTRRLGTNIGLFYKPFDFLSFDVSYSFINALFASGANKDNKVPLVPSHKLQGSINVKLPFGLEFGPQLEYTSAFHYGGDLKNELKKLDPWFLFGFRARYVLSREGREFSLVVTGKNLLDRQYAPYGNAYYDAWSLVPGWVYTLYPADGRSINISLQYRF